MKLFIENDCEIFTIIFTMKFFIDFSVYWGFGVLGFWGFGELAMLEQNNVDWGELGRAGMVGGGHEG